MLPELNAKLRALMEEGDQHPEATRVTVTFTKLELIRMVALTTKEIGRATRAENRAAGAVARATDPIESHLASKVVRAARDRRIVLEAFSRHATEPITYREAATYAEPDAPPARIESLRRRGSDLTEFGWIEQFGHREGTTQSVFAISTRGLQVLAASA